MYGKQTVGVNTWWYTASSLSYAPINVKLLGGEARHRQGI